MKTVQKILSRYFAEGDLGRIEVRDDTVCIGGFIFDIDYENERILLQKWPRRKFELVHSQDSPDGVERNTWEAVAYIKVRILRTAEEIVDLARSGKLYDEDYYMRRGGGSPYVGYPVIDSGYSEDTKFQKLAAEVIQELGVCRILDLGCADGIFVRRLQGNGMDAYGVDISQYAVQNAVCSHVYLGDARTIPFHDAMFDSIVSHDFMEHMHPDDMEIVLREQRRVLRQGGVAFHFIPFYEEYKTPVSIDAHLCNANKQWWDHLFSQVPYFVVEYAPAKDNQWDYSNGVLCKYYRLKAR